MEEKRNDQELARIEKVQKLIDLGVEPFGSKYERDALAEEIRAKVGDKTNEELDALNYHVKVAGRIMAIRRMGKASFINIQDKSGRMQGYIGLDVVGEKSYEIFKLADIGDIVGLEGRVMKTRTGELTIRVDHYTHLSKALKPFPEKFHGLTDVEERYRRRYLDLIMNEDAKSVAILRPRIIRSIQKYLDERGFMEVETSILTPSASGAAARPFITHHNSLDKDFYLRIALELPLKKLIIGGLEKVYEIGRNFRNEGMDTKHNPEFTMMEIYEAYGDLYSMRELIENLIRTVNKEVTGSYIMRCGENEIDLSKPFRFVSMADLVKEKTGVDFTSNLTFEDAQKTAKQWNITLEKHENSVGHVLSKLFEELCEKELINPTFVYSYPIEISPLTKKGKDPRFTERFELFINGSELANAYSELNDPFDQKERFIAQMEAKKLGDEEAENIDDSFIEAMEYAMPPTGGIGIGIDRLVMLILNKASIREVILFPTMRDR